MMIVFTLKGPFVPYTRMTRRGKWVKPRAQRYLTSQEALSWQLREQMAAGGTEMIPRGTPLRITISIARRDGMHHRDLDNEVKAILDAAQGVVFEDDRWIDYLCAERSRGDDDITTIIIETFPNLVQTDG